MIIMRQVAPKIAKQITAPHKRIMMRMKQHRHGRGGRVGRWIWIGWWKRLGHNLDRLFHNRGVNGWQDGGLSQQTGGHSGTTGLFHQRKGGIIFAIHIQFRRKGGIGQGL